MKIKNISSLIIITFVACLFSLHCDRRSPLSASGDAVFDLRLSFAGKKVSGSAPAWGKTADVVSAAPVITKLVFRVFDGPEGQLIASDSIEIDPEQTSFRKNLLNVPAGANRVLEVWAFESIFIETSERFAEVISFSGRQADITVPQNDTVRIALALSPLPIPGHRVVLDVGDGSGAIGSSLNPVAISLANSDNLRGLQFDLVYDGRQLTANSVRGVSRLANFSNIEGRNVVQEDQANTIYRIIVFDQNRPPGEIPPVAVPAVPEPILNVLFNVTRQATAQRSTLRIISASATNADLTNFEVYAVEGFFTVRQGSKPTH
ncbi:MAG: hypothetical protein ONB46_00250 [candidate division KSB1 bacterium]|nr:hypothetical protein [candidate division KSB1 bacterium]MDZ7364726.1 hypothetical protein [candidate division KSB1 bacterium]MDZ7402526.1 hypothetical protein [candidate division KSB1 bacterium]